jgi:hypothetical protein
MTGKNRIMIYHRHEGPRAVVRRTGGIVQARWRTQ